MAEGRSWQKQRSLWACGWVCCQNMCVQCVCCGGIHGSLWKGRLHKPPFGIERHSSLELSLGLAPHPLQTPPAPQKEMKSSISTPQAQGPWLTTQAPGLKSALAPTLPLHALSHARLVLFVPAQSRLAGAGPEVECQVCGSSSGVWGTWPSTQPRPPSARALLRAVVCPPALL